MDSKADSGEDVLAQVELGKLFHRINRVLPEDQELASIVPSTPVGEAIALMKRKHLSQLPIELNGRIIGIFSYRHFSQQVLSVDAGRVKLEDVPVEVFAEKPSFARLDDEFVAIFELLDSIDAVLVGEADRVQGIVTPMDVLRYLYSVARPYVLVAEIELAVRALIELSTSQNELADCAARSLRGKYSDDTVPLALEDMSFHDYVQIIGDGRNWKHFQPVFGGLRNITRTRLRAASDLRNTVFHFKGELSIQDYEKLSEVREWTLMRVQTAGARLGAASK